MDADNTRVPIADPKSVRAGNGFVLARGAAAPRSCQRKSSRGAGAEPLQSCGLPRHPLQPPSTTLSSYLRDNSDPEIGPIPFTVQRDATISGVEGLGGEAAAIPEFLSECSPRDKPWDHHREHADRVAEIYATHPDFQVYAGRVSLCSL